MLRAVISVSLLLLVVPGAPPQAQDRTPASRIAAIEGPQSAPGPNELGKLTIDELLKRFNAWKGAA